MSHRRGSTWTWGAPRASWPRTRRGPLASGGRWPPTRARGGAANRHPHPPMARTARTAERSGGR
eukprot:7069670-Prymnesium_polylepis.1